MIVAMLGVVGFIHAENISYWIEDYDGNYFLWVKVNISAGKSIYLNISKGGGSPNGDEVFEYFNDNVVEAGEGQVMYSWGFDAIGYVIETLVEPTGSDGGVPYFTDGASNVNGANLYMNCTTGEEILSNIMILHIIQL